MKDKLLFLGTGGSMGIPVVGCECAVCHSDNPKNKRLRPSVFLTFDEKQLLVDAGPEFRIQALRYGIHQLDGVLFTHSHHDHTAGIDDLRALSFKTKKPFPALLSDETAKDLKTRYYYLFDHNPTYEGMTTQITMQILKDSRGSVVFEGVPIRYLTYEQGGMQVNGFIIGSVAYLSDIKNYPETIFEDLEGVDTLVLSALRFTPSKLHFSIDEAVDFASKVGVEKVWLTHISHDLEHDKTNAYLPPHVRMAYDGLEIDI